MDVNNRHDSLLDRVPIELHEMMAAYLPLDSQEAIEKSLSTLKALHAGKNLYPFIARWIDRHQVALHPSYFTSQEETLAICAQLEYVNVASFPLQDIESIYACLYKIKKLFLPKFIADNIKFDEKYSIEVKPSFLPELKKITSLQVLSFQNCDKLDDRNVWMLSLLTTLQELHLLECSEISNAALEFFTCFKQLKTLSITHNQKITSAGLVSLQSLTNLQKLNFTGCCILAKDIQNLTWQTSLKEISFA